MILFSLNWSLSCLQTNSSNKLNKLSKVYIVSQRGSVEETEARNHDEAIQLSR